MWTKFETSVSTWKHNSELRNIQCIVKMFPKFQMYLCNMDFVSKSWFIFPIWKCFESYAGVLFWSRKEGFILTWWTCLETSISVHSIFSSKFMITCLNPILVHYSKVQISDFSPDSYFESKLDQNRTFEKWTKIGIGSRS